MNNINFDYNQKIHDYYESFDIEAKEFKLLINTIISDIFSAIAKVFPKIFGLNIKLRAERYKIIHVKHLEKKINFFYAYNKKESPELLIPARNISRKEVLRKKSDIKSGEELYKKLNIPNMPKLTIKHETDGVCFGASLNFLKKYHKHRAENREQVENNVAVSAFKFMKGCPKKAAALQKVYADLIHFGLNILASEKHETINYQQLIQESLLVLKDGDPIKQALIDLVNFQLSEKIIPILKKQVCNGDVDSILNTEFPKIGIEKEVIRSILIILKNADKILNYMIFTLGYQALVKKEIAKLIDIDFSHYRTFLYTNLKNPAFDNMAEGTYQVSFAANNLSHAMAFINENGKKYLFDPTLGLFKIENENEIQFIKRHIEKNYCPITKKTFKFLNFYKTDTKLEYPS